MMSTDAQTATLIDLVQRGASLAEAGRQIGVVASTVCRRLQPFDDVRRRRRRSITPATEARILRYSDNGESSVRAIAAQVHQSWHAVRRILDKHRRTRRVAVYRCPGCNNRLYYKPCLICPAINANPRKPAAA